eukprot:2908138-Rhodomonas_salina.2
MSGTMVVLCGVWYWASVWRYQAVRCAAVLASRPDQQVLPSCSYAYRDSQTSTDAWLGCYAYRDSDASTEDRHASTDMWVGCFA